MASGAPGSRSWWHAYARAALGPAARRAAGLWAGAALGAGLLGDLPAAALTRALRGDARLAAAVGVGWLLLFLPVARALARAEATAYLRALPAPRGAPALIAAAGVAVLQLPWTALWLAGEGPAGGLVVAGTGALALGLARVRWPAPATAAAPRWRGPWRALVGLHARGLRRLAPDALLRAAGLALLAGAAAGALVRRSEVEGEAAAVLGTTAILLVSAPGLAGLLAPLLEAERAAAWLARALGIGPARRALAAAATVAALFAGSAALAVVSAVAVAPPRTAGTTAALAGVALAAHAAAALAATRVLRWAGRSPAAAPRVVVGACATIAAATLALGLLGAWALGALAAAAAVALASACAPTEEDG